MAISYTINADNYTSSPTFNCMVNDSVNIAGYKASTLTGYGIISDSTVLPGCSYTKIVGNVQSMSGTASTRGTYSFVQKKVSSGKYTTGGTITINVKATWYQKIFFNANGGSGAPSTQNWSTTAVNQPSASSRTISSTVPTRTGYTFKGWSTSSSATIASYQPGGSISLSYSTSSSAGTTLYAVWWGNWKAMVNYEGNGGTGVPEQQTSSITQYNKPSDASFTIPDTIPTREGFRFLGWDENQYATTPMYLVGDTVSATYAVTEQPKTLYAIWEEVPENVQMSVKQDGEWVKANVFVKVDGEWVTPSNVYGKVNGEWKQAV